MATIVERLGLGPDEFALHFETEDGVNVNALAEFLKRTATVAGQKGAELRIVGLRDGSLAVVLKAIRKGAKKEFKEKPIDTTIKISVFLGSIVVAIIESMSGITPIAKAGAEVVESHQVTQISIVTVEHITVVMNEQIAKEVREAEQDRQLALAPKEDLRPLPAPVERMLRDARTGDLSGETALVGGQLHFRPDGYRYWVPIEGDDAGQLRPLQAGRRFRVSGHIALNGGLPDRIVINHAQPVPH